MIPLPKLDDRKWDDLVREAIDLIPKYCPEWTNHNASDPGITLIELFAWLIEILLYRLNRVADKNYLAFLDLMGIELQPPHPARASIRPVKEPLWYFSTKRFVMDSRYRFRSASGK